MPHTVVALVVGVGWHLATLGWWSRASQRRSCNEQGALVGLNWTTSAKSNLKSPSGRIAWLSDRDGRYPQGRRSVSTTKCTDHSIDHYHADAWDVPLT